MVKFGRLGMLNAELWTELSLERWLDHELPPVLAAAGLLTATGAGMIEAAEGGAAGVVTVTISPRTATGQAAAAMAPVKTGRGTLLNAGRWPTLPLDDWTDLELPEALVAAGRHRIPLIASVGYAPAEIREVVPALARTGVDGFELSCQHPPPDRVVEAARALREAAGELPVIAKLSANAPDLGGLAEALGPFVDAIARLNAVGPGLRIDIETGRALLGTANGFGWITGAALRPLAVRAVYEVARRTKKPVLGVGGVSTGRDAAEMLLVGASAVEVCSQAVIEGPKAFSRIAKELSAWMDAHGYPTIAALRGAYLERWGSGQRVVLEKEEAPEVRVDACIGCTICERVCFYDAITAPPKVVATVHDEPCFQCGMCVSACPVDALAFVPRAEVTQLP